MLIALFFVIIFLLTQVFPFCNWFVRRLFARRSIFFDALSLLRCRSGSVDPNHHHKPSRPGDIVNLFDFSLNWRDK